jgi:hypothetical protein
MWTLQLRAAAEMADKARFPTTLIVLPEGIAIHIENADREFNFMTTWRQLDGTDGSDLAYHLQRGLAAVQHDLDAIIQGSTGVRPVPRPPGRLP